MTENLEDKLLVQAPLEFNDLDVINEVINEREKALEYIQGAMISVNKLMGDIAIEVERQDNTINEFVKNLRSTKETVKGALGEIKQSEKEQKASNNK